MAIYYRFQHEKPISGEEVHCWKSLEEMKGFATMMRQQDLDFYRMKFWEIEGTFVEEDDGDAVVRVHYVKQIYLK